VKLLPLAEISNGSARVTECLPGSQRIVVAHFAEQACVDEDHAPHMPRDLDFTAAAAVPLAGLTALQALRDAGAARRTR
jgi:NADPH:quinone reductase-like Zn-dependent oxidoreductase